MSLSQLVPVLMVRSLAVLSPTRSRTAALEICKPRFRVYIAKLQLYYSNNQVRKLNSRYRARRLTTIEAPKPPQELPRYCNPDFLHHMRSSNTSKLLLHKFSIYRDKS
jgi:hypothetical protein